MTALETVISDYLLFANLSQLLIFSAIVLIAGIVRGCIGFGFSAMVVMSTSFWLPVASIVTIVVLLEIIASIAMYPNVKQDIKSDYIVPLSAGSLVTIYLGIWMLANLATDKVQWIMGTYMMLVAVMSLIGFEFKGEITRTKLFVIGMVAGFFNGLAGVGGMFVAWSLVGLKSSARKVRATMVVFFLVGEALFLFGAIANDFVTQEVIFSSIYATLPLVIGVVIGSRLSGRFSDDAIKKLVLGGLIILSLTGLYKTIF